DVRRPIRCQALRHPEARVGRPLRELDEAHAWQMTAQSIVGRPEIADLSRLEERGGELGARRRHAEIKGLTDELERLRRVAAGIGEMGGEAGPQPPRPADVEQPAILAQKMVHAGRLGYRLQTFTGDVDDERATVGRVGLEVDELVEPPDAEPAELLDEDT